MCINVLITCEVRYSVIRYEMWGVLGMAVRLA